MKALTDRLLWVRRYIVDPHFQTDVLKEAILDDLVGAIAIAEALPEITITLAIAPARRKPPKRIIGARDG